MSELRFNPFQGEWVLIAPKRHDKKKPRDIFEKKQSIPPQSKCPFENFEKSGNLPPYFKMPEKGSWHVMVFPNKFPGVDTLPEKHVVRDSIFYVTLSGYGYHDLLITKNHNKNFSQLPLSQVNEIFTALRTRYMQVSGDPRIDYIAMFQNRGPTVGASLYHPHMQVIALPVVPSHISHELIHSRTYLEKNHSCMYCDIIASERKENKRIVFQNEHSVAFVPYAAQEPYEVLIFPKKHEIFFEQSSDELMKDMAQSFKKVMNAIGKKLHNPDYNFYIHAAPATNGGEYRHHHWYVRILPKYPPSNYTAGFELGTGIQINTIFPEEAAKTLKVK